ncbi:MAG: hypothetical protein H7125_16055 [Proteobacteria bacterium]|nr:hypothetical protein [Burkholderiales bacterium]
MGRQTAALIDATIVRTVTALRGVLCAGCVGALIVALIVALPAHAQTSRPNQRLLIVNQTVTEPSAGVRSTVSARVGTLAFGANRLASDRAFETLANASAIAQVAVRDFGSTLTQAQILAQARAHVAGQAGALASALRSAVQARGLGQASFVFDQRVIVAGAARPRQLVWTLSVDSAGRASFGDPQLFDEQPTILHAQYIPLRVAAGLPQGWAYPDGGQLRWQLLNLQMVPIGSMRVVDTGGAFDPPEDSTGAPIDPESGLRCLIDRRALAGCPAGTTDMVTLIDQNAATGALLDYGQRLAPVYDAVARGPGSYEQVARVSLQIDLREITYTGCTTDMPYRNAGQYGFTLQSTSDRYQVTPAGRFSRLNSTQSTSLSPTLRYDWTRLLRPVAVSTLVPMILDPQDPNRPLLAASTVPNLLSLAPITTRGTEVQTLASYVSSPSDATRVQLDIQCSVSGRWTARSIIAPWAQCHRGGCNSDYYPYETSFTPGQAALGPYRWTAITYAGTPWEPQQIDFDGADTITFWHMHASGCNQMVGAKFSLAGQYLGVTDVMPCPVTVSD